MNHYTVNQINEIKSYIDDKSNLIQQTIDWVDLNLKYEDRSDLLLKLKGANNTLKKISTNIHSKPVMAVFGASQVGKSYLIKSLLSSESEPFLIKYGDKSFDFLKDINPPGTGAESTGIVTRFSIDNVVKFQDFPIKVKLLSPKDILIIILDAYFLDLKEITSFINRNDIEVHIKKLELAKDEFKQNVLSEYDVLEIKSYFENHLSKHSIIFEGLNETRFFERIARIIGYFDKDMWVQIFGILWNKNEDLTQLFNRLINHLHQVNYAKTGFLPIESVLRGHGEILDVKNLLNLNADSAYITFKSDNGEECQINKTYLSSLISELIFTIPEELKNKKEFLENSDLLDFPGARTRLGIEANSIHKNISQMLLRGKVSYLFNKYTDDFSINNLLFCINDKQLEINELSYLLFNWISRNIGKTVEERTYSLADVEIPPLFVIFTFFNNQLRYDTTNDEGFLTNSEVLNNKWQTRFIRFFENEIVTNARNWHKKWSLSSGSFKNFYLLRDYKYSDDTYAGFENEGRELKIRDERVSFLQALKESFTNFGFVKEHFRNPQKSWDEATALNKDGSNLIIENLAKVSNNKAKINHYLNLLNSTIEELKLDLVKFIHTDDITELRKKNMNAVTQFQLQFTMALTKDFNLFNKFINILSIQPVDIFNLLNENMVVDVGQVDEVNENSTAQLLMITYPELENAQSQEEVYDILKSRLWLSSNEEVESHLDSMEVKVTDLFKSRANTKTKSEIYTELVLDHWEDYIDDLDNFEALIQNGVNQSNIEFVLNHFKTILQKRNISNKLVKILNEVVSEIDVNRGQEEFLAETFALIINDVVYNLDLNFITEDEKQEIRKMTSERIGSSFEYKHPVDDQTIAALFNNENLDVRTLAMEKYKRWMDFLRISFIINSGFVNYNEKANDELKSLTQKYQIYNPN